MVPRASEVSELLELFTRYNQDLWPVHVVAYAAGVAAVALLFTRRRKGADRSTAGILAVLWLWLGVVFHGLYATDVNVVLGLAYGALFVLQAYLFIRYGVRRGELVFRTRNGIAGALGWIAVGYTIVVYPMVGVLLGHGWPQAPLLGMAPCPTTILTFGLLLLARPPIRHGLLAVPLLWALLAPPAAMGQGAYEDAGLLLIGVIGTGLILLRDRSLRRVSGATHEAPASEPALR